MVKVVPTEERAEEASVSEGKETIASNDENVAAEQQPTKDDLAEGQPTTSTTAGAYAVEKGQRLSSAVSDAAGTGSDVELSPPRSTDDPSRKPSESEEMHREAPQQLKESGALATAEVGPDAVVGNIAKDVAPTLDMDKHSGMTTFSLMRHEDDESSLDRPEAGLSAYAEEEIDDENATETMIEGEEENGEVSEGPPRLARKNTGVARKFVRQNTGIGDGALTAVGTEKKKALFRVPQTMYMGHPVGSPAAEFLERQQHRLAEIKTRREEVAGLLELVMEHNPKSTGSSLPDIDEVFPDKRGREKSQDDWCV